MVTAVWMEVGRKNREADIPPVTVADDGCGQHLGSSRQGRLCDIGVDLLDGPKQPPKGAGVIVHADGAEGRQHDRTRMPVTYPNRAVSVPASLISEPEAVAAAALALRLRETDPAHFASRH